MSRRAALDTIAVAIAGLALWVGTGTVRAEDFREGFDEGPPTWRPGFDRGLVRPLAHRRQQHMLRGGSGAEQFMAEVSRPGGELKFVHSLPPAVVIDELKLAVWVRATQAGPAVHLRLVFPEQVDPESGGPLTCLLAGERYTTPNEWQRLTCATTSKAVQDELRRLRYRLGQPDLTSKGVFADQAVVTADCGPGPVEVLFDELSFGPIVDPDRPAEILSASLDLPEPDAPVEFRLNRLEVEGKPFFPRIVPLHDEPVDAIKASGVNVAWIFDYRDDALLERLRAADLWATATPPRVPDDDGRVKDAQTAGLLPFGPETRPILFWNLGPRVGTEWLDEVTGWVRQVRTSDRTYDRPCAIDVTGGERTFSRHVPMLAASRHITHTAIPYDTYREWLNGRRLAAWPGTFFWTWVGTEPADAAVAARRAAGQRPLVLEPEQLRLQVYAALSAGSRGIGYWKELPLDSGEPGAEERRLAMAQLNLELELLEPLLATAVPHGQPIPFKAEPHEAGSSGTRTRPGYSAVDLTGPTPATDPFAPKDRPHGPVAAAVLKSEKGTLLLPVWYGDGAQFCPGPMAANNVQIVVPGVDETSSAWELTTTGVRNLKADRVAGGKRVTLPRFDQTTAILFTADPSVIESLHPVAEGMAAKSAAATVALARAKRDRVIATHHELTGLETRPPSDGASIAQAADRLLKSAETALARRDHKAAKQSADEAMQMLRILQRAHWEDAVRALSSPLTSPHTVSYSTLPDHYRLVARLGRSEMTAGDESNLLPTGDFEDFDRMLEVGWTYPPGRSVALDSGAELNGGSPQQGKYALRLYAKSPEGVAPPPVIEDSPVTVKSAPIPVRAGQILHVSGSVRVTQAIAEHHDGATLHDNLLGPSAGLRWTRTGKEKDDKGKDKAKAGKAVGKPNGTEKEKGDWETFQLLREIPQDGSLVLTFSLHGVGEVLFDDVKVVPHEPPAPIAQQVPAPTAPPAPRTGFDKFVERLPKLPSGPTRR